MPKPKLVLFDVDGTLLESSDFDAECYVAAVKAALGLERVDDDWSHYRNATDAGILEEIYQERFGREIPAEVSAQVQERFLAEMRQRLRGGEKLAPVKGAQAALQDLAESGEWLVAIATGAWRASAELKLQNAGLSLGALRLFTCEDSVSRTGIMEQGIKAISESIKGRLEKVVYVGDAPWDVKASRELGVAFLGIGRRGQELLEAGASHALRDYYDRERFLSALESCSPPKS